MVSKNNLPHFCVMGGSQLLGGPPENCQLRGFVSKHGNWPDEIKEFLSEVAVLWKV